jgi:hypothetical protein
MKFKILALAAVAATATLATAAPASAYVACNGRGDCWHTSYRDFRPHWGVRIHDDNWRWRGHGYRWREHEGRGYWGRNHVWVTF